jgi:SDR family mycofactocin-dependent oxidoreductase
MSRFEGKVALVTGAARGQGRALAERLAREGASIVAVDLCEQVETVDYPMATPADLEETVRVVEALGARITADRVDVRDGAALTAAVDARASELGGLDIVLANAGIAGYPQGSLSIGEEEWRNMIDINLTGVWNTCRGALPHLVERGGGAIVITSSLAGLKGYPNIPHYVAAKHALVGLSRTLAIEFGADSVRVNSVHPTSVATEMVLNDGCYRLFRPDLENPGRDDFAAASQETHLLPKPWVEIEDVVNCVLFLASEEARSLTGVALPVDLGAGVK